MFIVSITNPKPNHDFPITYSQVGNRTKFVCDAKAKLIDFLINGTSADYQSNYEKGFDQSLISSTTTKYNIQRTLWVTITGEINNTYISCRALSAVTREEIDAEFRDVAYLIVEGIIYYMMQPI